VNRCVLSVHLLGGLCDYVDLRANYRSKAKAQKSQSEYPQSVQINIWASLGGLILCVLSVHLLGGLCDYVDLRANYR
jgi:quinol-cytochrome oxidoreductase complex cytochrome b subunit